MKGSFSGRGLPPPVIAKSGSVSLFDNFFMKHNNFFFNYSFVDGSFVV